MLLNRLGDRAGCRDRTERGPLGVGDAGVHRCADCGDRTPAGRWRRGPTRRQLLAVGLVVVLVAGAVVTTWQLTRNGSSSASAAPLAVTTQKVTVSAGTIKETVSASGTIEPASQADLSFAVSGQVTGVDVAVGQKVASGQTLATMGTTALQDDVDAASETLLSDQSRLSSDESSSASTSQIDSDQAAVTSAESQLATAKQNLADANLTSTIAGTVASINLSAGQEVSGTGSSGDATGNSGATGSGGLGSSSAGHVIVLVVVLVFFVVIRPDRRGVHQRVRRGYHRDDTQVGQSRSAIRSPFRPAVRPPRVRNVSSVGLVAQSAGSGDSSVASFPVVVAVTEPRRDCMRVRRPR